MRFSTILTVLAAGAMAIAGVIPDIAARGSITDIQNSFTNLGNQCPPIVQKYDGCVDDNCTTNMVNEIISTINTCKSGAGSPPSGTPGSDLANAVSGAVNQIASCLEDHKNKCGGGCPNILTTYAKVDASLADCLSTYFNVAQGLSTLVPPLLSGFVSTLKDIGLSSVLKACMLG